MKDKFPLIIVADMGATYSRLAFIDEYQALRHVKVYLSTDFNSPKDVIDAYLAEMELPSPDHILIAVAAPTLNDHLVLTNNHWDFSQREITQELNTKVTFINDFEALSLSLDHFSQQELIEIGQHHENKLLTNAHFSKVVIGAGTGFGAAINLQTPNGNISIPSEGGHALYAPQDAEETEIVNLAIKDLNRAVIIEDILACKHGVPRLITIMADIHKANLTFEATPKALLSAALEAQDPFAITVLNRYCMMLGNTASNIALTTGAAGGVYIGGGFAPRFSEFLQASKFRECFTNKESVVGILSAVPTYLIMHPYATLVGLQQILPRYIQG